MIPRRTTPGLQYIWGSSARLRAGGSNYRAAAQSRATGLGRRASARPVHRGAQDRDQTRAVVASPFQPSAVGPLGYAAEPRGLIGPRDAQPGSLAALQGGMARGPVRCSRRLVGPNLLHGLQEALLIRQLLIASPKSGENDPADEGNQRPLVDDGHSGDGHGPPQPAWINR